MVARGGGRHLHALPIGNIIRTVNVDSNTTTGADGTADGAADGGAIIGGNTTIIIGATTETQAERITRY